MKYDNYKIDHFNFKVFYVYLTKPVELDKNTEGTKWKRITVLTPQLLKAGNVK